MAQRAANRQNDPDKYAAKNKADATKVNTALAVLGQKLGSGTASKYNAVKFSDDLKWQTEKVFVTQIFQRNVLLCEALLQSPTSLLAAMQSAASLGMTLDPNLGLAYLIPQRQRLGAPYEVCLKVSYKGMEQGVLRSGTVVSITTELVHSNDTFRRGVRNGEPFVEFEMARGPRGDLEGVFCIAKYANGESHVEWMPIEDIDACEAAAKENANGKTGSPWYGPFRPEQQKKCCVRRAAKHWPTSPVLTRLLTQYDIENPMDFDKPVIDAESVQVFGDAQVAELEEMLKEIGPDQVAVWLKLKAEAAGFSDIREVPIDRFDAFKEQLAHRLKLVTEKIAARKAAQS